MATLAVIVDWSGPFSSTLEAIEAAEENGCEEILYLATGTTGKHKVPVIQYVGIARNIRTRFNDATHPIHTQINGELEIWVGEVISPGLAGRKAAGTPVTHSRAVDRAEWAIAYFLEVALNRRKRVKPPHESLVLTNRWFFPDFATRRHKRRHTKDWPDFIEYDKEDGYAAIQWFGAPPRRKRLLKDDIAALSRRQERAV